MVSGYQRRMPPIRVGFHDRRRGDPGGQRGGALRDGLKRRYSTPRKVGGLLPGG
jgi:hypothetical protein